MNDQNQECCPEFDTGKWNEKSFSWDNKPFIRESIPTFFHFPIPAIIGKKMKKMYELADKAQANIPDLTEALILFRDPSSFKSEIYYSVTKEVEGAKNVGLTGDFIAGVFDGPYNSVPRHIKEMDKRLAETKQKAKDYYIHYAYCPKCATKFGHNYMILFAQV